MICNHPADALGNMANRYVFSVFCHGPVAGSNGASDLRDIIPHGLCLVIYKPIHTGQLKPIDALLSKTLFVFCHAELLR